MELASLTHVGTTAIYEMEKVTAQRYRCASLQPM